MIYGDKEMIDNIVGSSRLTLLRQHECHKCRNIDDVIRPSFGASVFVWTSRCESDGSCSVINGKAGERSPSRNLSVSESTAHHETMGFDHFLIRSS